MHRIRLNVQILNHTYSEKGRTNLIAHRDIMSYNPTSLTTS